MILDLSYGFRLKKVDYPLVNHGTTGLEVLSHATQAMLHGIHSVFPLPASGLPDEDPISYNKLLTSNGMYIGFCNTCKRGPLAFGSGVTRVSTLLSGERNIQLVSLESRLDY